MFAPLTRAGLGGASPAAQIYCRPACFVDRPHELDDACLRVADTMVWFAAWHISLRDGLTVQSAIIPVPELADWIAAMPNALASMATQLAKVSAELAEIKRGVHATAAHTADTKDGVRTLNRDGLQVWNDPKEPLSTKTEEVVEA